MKPPSLPFLLLASSPALAQAPNLTPAEFLPAPALPGLLGRTFYVQAGFRWTACTPSSSGLSTSDGLAVTIVP